MSEIKQIKLLIHNCKEIVYCNCYDSFINYEILICHKFEEVNTASDKLLYYITLNGDRIFYPEIESESNIYEPEILNRELTSYGYKTLYKIVCNRRKITDKSDDSVKINLILPFDHNLNIFDISVSAY